jgi:energy-coupling factor transporter ATP-binding protein EcfA2
MQKKAFPHELLEKSKEERFAYFKEYITEHPILDDVLAKLMRAINLPKSGQIIFVFGPTGVGKTTLIQSFSKKLIEKYLDEMERDNAFIPLISVEAPMPTVGNFNWADLFSDILEQLNEVSKDLQFFRGSKNVVDEERKKFFKRFGYSRYSKLRFTVEKSLEARKSKVITIDEAQHLAVLASARKLLDQPNTVKSIANRTETAHILFGNYDLLLLNNLNGQLSRRTEDIHFSRYAYEEEDIKSFKNIVWTFQNHLPTQQTPNLLGAWEYLYERSLGCVGILKEWLDRAFKLMLDDDDEELTVRHLEATALSESKCITIVNEIIAAEEKLSKTFEGEDSLKGILLKDKKDKALSKKKNTRKGTQVGVRKPRRDQIGDTENEK